MNKLTKLILQKKQTYYKINIKDFKNENELLDNIGYNLNCGTDVIELDCNTKASEIIKISKKIKLLCGEYNSLFIIKNRADIAFITDSDGIILSQDELGINDVKRLLDENKLIGKEITNTDQLENTISEGYDFITLQNYKQVEELDNRIKIFST